MVYKETESIIPSRSAAQRPERAYGMHNSVLKNFYAYSLGEIAYTFVGLKIFYTYVHFLKLLFFFAFGSFEYVYFFNRFLTSHNIKYNTRNCQTNRSCLNSRGLCPAVGYSKYELDFMGV